MNKYRAYLVLNIFVVGMVIAVFKLVEAKKVAAILNTLLFLISSLFVVFRERRMTKSYSFWGALIFLVFGVLPVASLRIIFWEVEFNSIVVLGHVTGADIHRFSNYPFILMLLSFFIDSYRQSLSERNGKNL